MRLFRTLFILVMAVFCSPLLRPADGRLWSDHSGKFRVEADFVKLDGAVAHLKKADGTIVKIPLSRLCADDRKFVHEQNRAEASPVSLAAKNAEGSQEDAEPEYPPKGQAPGFFRVTQIDEDTIELKGAGSTTYKSTIKDLEFYDAKGKKLTADELRKRVIKVGSVVVAASDENNVDPAYLSVLKEDTVVLVGVTVQLVRTDRPGRGWTMDLKKMKPSDDPVVGKILGAYFKLDKIQLQNTILTLNSGNDSIIIFLDIKVAQGIEGKSFETNGNAPQEKGRLAIRVNAVHIHVGLTNPPQADAFGQGFAMRLEFGKEKDGSIPGKLYLCLPDKKKSWIAGSFNLKLE